jgi:AraC-like DNA-binding protein
VAARKNATVGDLPTAPASTPGVLRPDEFARHVALDQRPAGPGADRWVDKHWSLRWDLADDRWFPSQVLPHPTCSLTVELCSHPRPALPPGETVVITGVATRRFDVDVRGWGRVVGVRFRPRGLAALCGRPAYAWTDRTVPARDLRPAELCPTIADHRPATSPVEWGAAAEAGLLDLPTRTDPRYDQLLDVVADMLADRSLLTVTEVARRHGVTLRTLQRLFTHYVGVGPKWVLARYRMHDVVTEIDEGYDGTLTDLAHRYGWYDQAHFTGDFTALVGVTPGQYRDRRDRPAAGPADA